MVTAAPATFVNSMRSGGMTFSWYFAGDEIYVNVNAPAQGWVAFGFNNRVGLTGTNFVMASVANGQTCFTDRTIIVPGDHRELPPGNVRLIGFAEEKNSTSLAFALKVRAVDIFHFELAAGKKFHLLLAYSRGKNFTHHSAYRETLEIRL